MRDDPVIAESARKHGFSVRTSCAFANPIRVFDLDEGFTMVIGASLAAIIYEIGVVEGVTASVIVHAMRARETFFEVKNMPRIVQEILDHADELAKRFEDYEPSPADERDPEVFAELRRAVLSRSNAERSVKDAVEHARERGYSWAFIGSLIGTSGEAARQRYGHKQNA